MAIETNLDIQDPTKAGLTLLDAIAAAAEGATAGGGIFAFASASGVRALLDDSAVKPVTEAGFKLVVGTDAVTDEKATQALAGYAAKRAALEVRMVLNDAAGLFHPKLIWFLHDDQLRLVVGSGNLTLGGLTTNVEASVTQKLTDADSVAAMAVVDDWLARWDVQLRPPDAAEILARVKLNSGSDRAFKRPMAEQDDAPGGGGTAPAEALVLVAEISKNAPRRTQMDVGMEHFREFFGGVLGAPKRILIQHVEVGGTVAALEPPRALIQTKSTNFRFEAGAGTGMEYPEEGRPIGLFLPQDGVFEYHLLWPGEPGHAEIEAFMTAEIGPPARTMRRDTFPIGTLRAAWSSLPLG